MSVSIDRKFLYLISPKLTKFSQKKTDLYNFRCPICLDSQKNKTKCRGYIYRKKNDYFYRCHNCNLSTTFYNFLNLVDPSLIKEYQLERYTSGETGYNNYPKPEFEELKSKPLTFKKSLGIDSVNVLPEDHTASIYCSDRKIPKEKWDLLYYTNDFKKFVNDLGVDSEKLIENDERLVIPFYNKEKVLTHVQGRTLTNSKIRYITIKISEDSPKIFGLENVNEDDPIHVVEGPIDSLFLENCVAVADSNLKSITEVFDRSKVILVFDNEPRNKEITKYMEKAIDEHFNVVIWPEFIESKDINEMILDGFSQEELTDIIHKNTFVNLRAKMEFVNWRKN